MIKDTMFLKLHLKELRNRLKCSKRKKKKRST